MFHFRPRQCVSLLLVSVVIAVVFMALLAYVANTGSTSSDDKRWTCVTENPYIISNGLVASYEKQLENSPSTDRTRQNSKQNIGSRDTISSGDHCPPLCPILPRDLGLSGSIPVNLTAPTWTDLEALHPELQPGGRWKPKTCRARSRIAIVVPYMNRDKNLRIFLQHMHPFLQKQQLEYGIYLAEPTWKEANRTMQFNRGLMRNIGFHEATKNGEYDCVIFHDLDLLPEVDYNNYGCPDVPRHMCIAVSYLNYKPFNQFGGIVAFRTDHFAAANGYSNIFFGWGGEDDDLGRRCSKDSNVGIYKIPESIGRYKEARHWKNRKASGNHKLWTHGNTRWTKDGLNSLNYTLLTRERRVTYTWLFVDYPEQLYKQAREDFLNEIEKEEETINARKS